MGSLYDALKQEQWLFTRKGDRSLSAGQRAGGCRWDRQRPETSKPSNGSMTDFCVHQSCMELIFCILFLQIAALPYLFWAVTRHNGAVNTSRAQPSAEREREHVNRVRKNNNAKDSGSRQQMSCKHAELRCICDPIFQSPSASTMYRRS